MTATTAPAPLATAHRVRDLRTLWRVLIAVALPVGPLLVVITRWIMPYWTTDDGPTMISKSLAHLDRLNTMAWLALFAIPALVISMLAIGYVARRGAPVLATIGAGLSFLAYVNWSAAGNSDFLVLTTGQAGVDPATINKVLDATSNHHAVAAISGFGWVIGHILGTVLLGIALMRAKKIPTLAGIAMIVSQPVHLIAAIIVPSRILDVVAGWGLTTVAFTFVAVAILRTRNDDWDLPPVVRPASRVG
jgi:hypothetical protein